MLKDPNHQTETPYELLKLPFNASLEEVHKALPRFMRDKRNIARLGRAQEAVRQLQNAAARAAEDIWLYHLNAPEANELPDRPAMLNLDEFREIPALPPQELCGVEGADLSTDFQEIAFRKVTLSEAPSFDGIEEIRLMPHFDR